MKKTLVTAIALLSLCAVHAQTVTEDSFTTLKVSYATPELELSDASLYGVSCLVPNIEDYHLGGQVGSPALPVRSDIIVIPFCAKVHVTVVDAVYDTLNCDATLPWMPLQPSRSKSDRSTPTLTLDKEVYATDAFVGQRTATVEVLGIARDRRLAQLTFSPVRVNPVTGQYIICRKAEVIVTYEEADPTATINHYERYHTPAFNSGSTLNRLFSSKSVHTSAPVRMVIVAAPSLRCQKLELFADWKRRQGFLVDLTYNNESNVAIAAYLKSFYDNATPVSPAPTYVLLVGDRPQMPAFNTKVSGMSSHVTDLYYTTWSQGDNLPDAYAGRFSATDTGTLYNIINKTLQYESYNFSDDSYLTRATLVAGVDQTWYVDPSDHGYNYADPTMDYIAKYYVKAANGFTDLNYFKNDTSIHPPSVKVTGRSRDNATAARLRTRYDAGCGLINYSAHGDWNEWSAPSFTVTHVNSMSNNNMPSVMIGNCCLSNKFDEGVCFGEALLRRPNNAGAVAYIGATDYTYWSEDFYWTVGVRGNISSSMTLTYDADRLGAYDRLFHTHYEEYHDWAVTVGSMIYHGNLSVNSSTSGSAMKQYYWEVYELMGDPSLMPWLGRAQDLTFSASDNGSSTVVVTTVPYAYVAVVDTADHHLVAAAFADSQGSATLSIPAGVSLDATFYAVTAQGYKPYFSSPSVIDIPFVQSTPEVTLFPNPATEYCILQGVGTTNIQLFDARGAAIGSYTPVDSSCYIDLRGLPRGLYYVAIEAADSLRAKKLIVR